MNSNVLLTYYCLLILLVSIAGGMIPVWVRLSHRWMECAVSFVAGVMLGIGLLHMLPPRAPAGDKFRLAPGNRQHASHAVAAWRACLRCFSSNAFSVFTTMKSKMAKLLATTVLKATTITARTTISPGAAQRLGLTLHSVIEGIALAAGVAHGHETVRLAGLGTFLVIILHKPFDSMTIATLMAHGGWSLTWRHVVNGLFSLAIPLGILIFRFGLMGEGDGGETLSHALAFAAGTFLCIALSDLLPELQFHDHDRGKLSAALLLGLALAWGISQLESTTHSHPPALPEAKIQIALATKRDG